MLLAMTFTETNLLLFFGLILAVKWASRNVTISSEVKDAAKAAATKKALGIIGRLLK